MTKPFAEKLVGYFPVLHRGYEELLLSHPDASVHILGSDVLRRFSYLRKDIRALSPETSLRLIEGLGRAVTVVTESALPETMLTPRLVMPDDDVSHTLAAEFEVNPSYDPVFLRWDRERSTTNVDVTPDRTIRLDSGDHIVQRLYEEADRSSNWWRIVAAAIVEGEHMTSLTHNGSVPTEYTSSIEGDPRITAKRGEAIERSIDIHAEARLIATHAKEGMPTKDRTIYVTTFPCSNCAKLIAEAGFGACYFVEGYATLDGQTILQRNGVEIVKIDTATPEVDSRRLRPYPTN